MEAFEKIISEFQKDSVYIRNAGCAISKNIGNTTVEGILFHIIRPNTMDEAYDNSSDASVVDASFYKILGPFESYLAQTQEVMLSQY